MRTDQPVRQKHPSGRPLRREQRPTWQDGYGNRDEPRTVRLRKDRNTQAIGFTAHLVSLDDEEE